MAPATIGIPQIAAAADGLENVKDLSDLADVMEQLRQAHPDKDILGIGSASALLKRLAATSAPKWITADGSIDREVLQEYLEQCKRIYDIQMDGLDQETVETYQERMGRLAEYYGVSADYLIGRCSYGDKKPLEMLYVTRDCSCEKLVQDILSLHERGRQSVVEYVELQKLREKQKE